MADQPVSNTPLPPPAPVPSIRKRSLINQARINEVSKTEALVAVVRKEEYRDIMADGDVDETFLNDLSEKLARARQIIRAAEQHTISALNSTKAEQKAKDRLMTAIRIVQARAKQTHANKNPGLLKEYFIGAHVGKNRATLESNAKSLLEKLQTTSLKGLKIAQIENLENALAAYKNTQTAQQGEITDAMGERVNLKELVGEIAAMRREIQFAADAQWPASEKATRHIRKEFGLPLTKPLPK